jgi:hypothetical protein
MASSAADVLWARITKRSSRLSARREISASRPSFKAARAMARDRLSSSRPIAPSRRIRCWARSRARSSGSFRKSGTTFPTVSVASCAVCSQRVTSSAPRAPIDVAVRTLRAAAPTTASVTDPASAGSGDGGGAGAGDVSKLHARSLSLRASKPSEAVPTTRRAAVVTGSGSGRSFWSSVLPVSFTPPSFRDRSSFRRVPQRLRRHPGRLAHRQIARRMVPPPRSSSSS